MSRVHRSCATCSAADAGDARSQLTLRVAVGERRGEGACHQAVSPSEESQRQVGLLQKLRVVAKMVQEQPVDKLL